MALEEEKRAFVDNAYCFRLSQFDGKSFQKEIHKITMQGKKVNHKENLNRYGKK